MPFDEILKLILGSAGCLVVLALALQWLNKDRDKLVTALNEERNGRIAQLEESSRRCAEDRIVMHKQMSDDRAAQQKEMNLLQAEVRELYKRMLAEADACLASRAQLTPEPSHGPRHPQ